MPKTRLEVAKEVYEEFRAAEEAVERSAAAMARCVATLIEARIRAKLPPAAGAEAMRLLADCSAATLAARDRVVTAHPLLDQLARDFDIVGYGPDKEPVPNEPFHRAASQPLRVVAAAG